MSLDLCWDMYKTSPTSSSLSKKHVNFIVFAKMFMLKQMTDNSFLSMNISYFHRSEVHFSEL